MSIAILERPIPQLETKYPDNLIIRESGEPFIAFTEQTHPRIFIRPMYYEQQLNGSVNAIYLREDAFQRIIQAVETLPTQYGLLLYDGYRPLSVQQHLFDNVKNFIVQQQPHLSTEELHAATLKYVAFPSLDKNATAPHLTGGAIDLTLTDDKGQPLPMGTDFDEVSPKSATAYFEQIDEHEEYRSNRRILYNTMIHAGFANYEEEWWHYEYGNKSWAARTNQFETKYAPIDLKLD